MAVKNIVKTRTHIENEPLPVASHDAWMCGDRCHQGDLIFVALQSMPKSAKPRTNRQLAEGTTIGSRHVVEGGELFDCDKAALQRAIKAHAKLDVDERYIGPVFRGECVVTHPKHQHQAFPGHAATVVLYQRNLDVEEREQRARD